MLFVRRDTIYTVSSADILRCYSEEELTNMTGRLYEKYGKYQAVLFYKDKDNKEKKLWRSTGYDIKGNKKKAETKLSELMEQFKYLEYKEEIKDGNDKILFTEAVKQWLKSKRNKIELSTYEGYMNYIDSHILPYFEPLHFYLDEITPKHIKNYYEDMFKSGRKDGKSGGLSVRSIKKHSIVLKQVFKEAVISEQIVRNPATGVPFPKNEKPEFKGVFLTGDEANEMLQAFAGHDLQVMVYITLYYGLRRSEVLGLKWNAVDFEKGEIKIKHTVVKNLTTEYKDKTKSKTSMRTFPLLDEVKEILLKLKEYQAENRRMFGKSYHNSDYIFVWQDGRLYRPDYITRSFQKVLKRHRLKMIRFHDLRHSTASILYDKGWNLKEIQEWLGHADIETTGNIYTQITNQRKQATAKSLEKTFII